MGLATRTLAALSCAVAVTTTSAQASAGRLQRAREAAGGSSGSSGAAGSVGAGVGAALGEAFGAALAAAVVEASRRMRYRPYPYADGGEGYIFWLKELPLADADSEEDDDETAAPVETPEAAPPARGRFWSMSLGLEGAFLPTDTVRGGLSSRLSLGVFELNTSWSYLYEFDVRDRLVLGDLNLALTAGARWIQMSVGAGPTFLADPTITDLAQRTIVGVNFVSTRLHVFPRKPLALGLCADVGRLRAATFWRLRATVGATLGRVELFAGYEHLQIGDVPLGGPMIGAILRI
ncbi:MAG: hypothetical protein KC636_05075 [Myxococcales bacterium]|nr:hypothetical protein [Myxococcales bacterium]